MQSDGLSDNALDLSIIIVNWNTRELLRECLSSIYEQMDGHLKYEVVVVDNNSKDNSQEMVKNTFPNVLLIANNENVGFVKANNIGMRSSCGRNILLLNSDTKLLDGAMYELLDYFDQHPDVGVMTGKVLNEDGSFQRPFRRFPHPLGAYMRHTFRLVVGFNTPLHRRYFMESVDGNSYAEVDWVTGAYLFVRRELLDVDRVFDEEIFMYYEDTLLCYRVKQKGYRCMYLPIAPIIHYGGESAKLVHAKAGFLSFRGSVYFIRATRGVYSSWLYYYSVISTWHILTAMFGLFSFVPYEPIANKAGLFRSLLAYSRQKGVKL